VQGLQGVQALQPAATNFDRRLSLQLVRVRLQPEVCEDEHLESRS